MENTLCYGDNLVVIREHIPIHKELVVETRQWKLDNGNEDPMPFRLYQHTLTLICY